MSWSLDNALGALKKVHEQVGDLEHILAELKELHDHTDEIIQAVEKDIERRDA